MSVINEFNGVNEFKEKGKIRRWKAIEIKIKLKFNVDN